MSFQAMKLLIEEAIEELEGLSAKSFKAAMPARSKSHWAGP